MKFFETTTEAREYFKEKGLTYKDLSYNDMERLRELLDLEINSFPNELKMKLSKKLKRDEYDFNNGLVNAYYFVDGYYFKRREAISFNGDGFIGFAGWSDSYNVKPMLNAFKKWIDEKVKDE